jgi:hypothetical protein
LRKLLVPVLLVLAALCLQPAAPARAATPPPGDIIAASCFGPTACVGLGNYSPPVNGVSAFLRTWNGTSWGPLFAPLPASADDQLTAIWCSSTAFCVAVGDAFTSTALIPFAATWNGSSWSAKKPPAPATSAATSWLAGVSCRSRTSCVAVGVYSVTVIHSPTGSVTEGLADTWNGTTWRLSLKLRSHPGAQETFLSDVSCRSTTCVAVGNSDVPQLYTARQQLTYRPVTEVWNGGGWTASTPPVPAGGHGVLADVSCWSAKGCVAVGDDILNHPEQSLISTPSVALAEYWNGRAWKSLAKPPAPGYSPALRAVSCLSSASCLAVGTGNGELRLGKPVKGTADYWNGRAWKSLPIATPPHGSGGTNGFQFYIAACQTPAACLALGAAGDFRTNAGLESLTFIAERYNGLSLHDIPDA